MGFADGGCLDNCAIMPLLRRGVKCLVVLMASSTPPDDTWELFARGVCVIDQAGMCKNHLLQGRCVTTTTHHMMN
jgi:hypothetical protein